MKEQLATIRAAALEAYADIFAHMARLSGVVPMITMVLGLWMVNVVFSFGHRLLNFQSARVTYFVNASLFIYLVHHPLTLFFGAYITPHITSNWLGFLCGLIFVVGIAIGMITPPVAINLFVASGITGQPIEMIAKAVIPYLIGLLFVFLSIVYLPMLIPTLII